MEMVTTATLPQKVRERFQQWFTWQRLALILILFIGLFMRLYGIAYGLPYFYGPPEIESLRTNFQVISPYGNDEIQFVAAVVNMLANYSLNPQYFAQPGTPTMYLLLLVFGVMLAFGLLTGAIPNIDAIGDLLTDSPDAFYLAGRVLIALIGVAGIPLVYRIGRRLYDRRAGLVAALIFALTPIHGYLSKIIRGDALMILCLLAAFWFCLDILESGRWRGYLGAGFFTGLAIVNKYPAVTFVAIIVLAHLLTHARRDHRRLIASGAACLGGAFIGSPYAFLDFPAVLGAVQAESSIHLGGASEGILHDVLWYLGKVLPNSISWAGVVL
ncbi:MAG: glycosyltransferase family 39 protein, partial [Anaerolineae bacterium]|nr:glycosyltransferase family 39 protein [Anaerolineae bacterium]